jgi:lysozyme
MLHGIDVSTLQGNINWRNVKADFAMIKATQGRGEGASTRHLRKFTDSQFVNNITGASAVGIPCGVYHYMTAQTVAEAHEEADYFAEVIAPYRDKITLWAAVDVESDMYLGGLNRTELTNITRAFINRIAAHGYKPMLYTNPNYITYRFLPNAFDDVDIWLAHYNVKTPKQVPRLKIWQYGVGTVAGVNANCDMNYGYFDIPTIATPKREIKAGDKVRIISGAKYTNDKPVPDRLVGKEFTATSVNASGVYIAALVSRIKREGLELV